MLIFRLVHTLATFPLTKLASLQFLLTKIWTQFQYDPCTLNVCVAQDECFTSSDLTDCSSDTHSDSPF